MSIGNYLTALDEQRDALARNLVTMGVQASETEKLNTLVPKVLQIPQTNPDVTLFRASVDALHDYGEKLYTFYNDGYRSLAGFTENYPHFCCEENGYAIYYNQPDFNWGQTIYTMCVEPFHISSNRKIMLSYACEFLPGMQDHGTPAAQPQQVFHGAIRAERNRIRGGIQGNHRAAKEGANTASPGMLSGQLCSWCG